MTKWMVKLLFLLLFLGLVPPPSAFAQSKSDTDSITSFVNSVAGTVYNMAWPTATYRKVRVNDVTSVPGGFDVVATFSGLSGMDGSDLWMRLVIELRSDGLHDIRVLAHNAFWAAPFETLKTVGNALVQMQQQYDRQHPRTPPATPPPPPSFANAPAERTNANMPQPVAGGACITNPTDGPITFSYRWGVDDWTDVKLESGDRFRMAWKYGLLRTAPELSIRYDWDFSPGYQERKYNLDNSPVFDAEDCSKMKNYHFNITDTKIVLYVD